MSRLLILNEASMAALLGQHADCVEATGRQRWQFRLGRGADLGASLRIERGWLQVSAPLDGDSPREAADRTGDISDDRLQAMLAANARLSGGVKFVLADDPLSTCPEISCGAGVPPAKAAGTAAPQKHGVHLGRGLRPLLAAEISLLADDDFELGERIGQLCRGLRQGARQWRHSIAEPGKPPGDVRRSAPAAHVESRFEEICRESGWTISRRANGRFAVRLDVREAFYQALVEPAEEGCRLCVALGQSVPDVDVCRRAVDVLLLSACGVVRMAAATVVPGEVARQYRWESALAAASRPKEWDHALSALTIACQTTVMELGALEDPALAEAYLQLRGTGRISP
jgi:hypothetical protein